MSKVDDNGRHDEGRFSPGLVMLSWVPDLICSWFPCYGGPLPAAMGNCPDAGSHPMLCTTGRIGNFGSDHGHVPSPVRIANHRGLEPKSTFPSLSTAMSAISTLHQSVSNSTGCAPPPAGRAGAGP